MDYDDFLRPLSATILLALYLPVPFYLLWLHGLHRLWRRIGTASYFFLLTPYVAMVVAVVRAHALWGWRADEWPQALAWLSIIPLGLAGWLAFHTYRTIEPATLHLHRQIKPSSRRVLITTGVLGRIRHPRYVMFTLLAVANVLATGYPLVAVSLGLTVLLLAMTIRLEERELQEYFGDAFRDYKRSVPAFIPRPSRGRRGAV